MCPERPEHLSEMRTIDFAVDAARKKMDAQGLEYGALMDYEEGEEEIFLWFEMLLPSGLWSSRDFHHVVVKRSEM
jgi:hypothetical protein